RDSRRDPGFGDVAGWSQQAVETRDAGKIRAGPGEIEHAEPAEAESDRGDAAGVDLGLDAGRIEQRRHPCLEQGALLAEGLHQREAFVAIGPALALAIEVAAE